MQNKKFGYVAFIGKPNVGKSTLMNQILGKKLSITSRKPQTTRHRILGIKNTDDAQVVYIDTPGLHQTGRREIHRVMNRAAKSVLHEADLILLMIEALEFVQADEDVVKQLKSLKIPVILVINKIDRVKNKSELLPFMDALSSKFHFAKIIPISAKKNLQVSELEKAILDFLPTESLHYPPEQFTDRSDQFIASEFIREKLMRLLGDELPYDIAVTLELFKQEEKIIRIYAIIWIEKDSQKPIVIGKGGALLKKVGTTARQDLELYYAKKVFLKLWVKVKSGWSDNPTVLREFGIN